MVQAAAISQQIWDMKYRLKGPDGQPVDKTIEESWRRVAHALAALTAVWLLVHASRARHSGWPGRLVVLFVIGQTVLGVVNLLLLAPLWLQMVHLVGSNLLWMAVVWAWLDARQTGDPSVANVQS